MCIRDRGRNLGVALLPRLLRIVAVHFGPFPVLALRSRFEVFQRGALALPQLLEPKLGMLDVYKRQPPTGSTSSP